MYKAMFAAQQIESRHPGTTVEVIDLRSLSPYDWNAIGHRYEKTSRVDCRARRLLSWGYGAEISARIADELFAFLDAPVGRVGALDTWVAYHPTARKRDSPADRGHRARDGKNPVLLNSSGPANLLDGRASTLTCSHSG